VKRQNLLVLTNMLCPSCYIYLSLEDEFQRRALTALKWICVRIFNNNLLSSGVGKFIKRARKLQLFLTPLSHVYARAHKIL
jgi:hypothetical protein